MFQARIHVTLKSTVNDPQGQTVLSALQTLGFNSVDSVRVGKYLEVSLKEVDQGKVQGTLPERVVLTIGPVRPGSGRAGSCTGRDDR